VGEDGAFLRAPGEGPGPAVVEPCARDLADDLARGVDAMSPARPVAGQRSKIQRFAVLAEEGGAAPLANDLAWSLTP
jgi:hypothetical protein